MLYLDYTLDISRNAILLDSELTIDRLNGVTIGDVYQVCQTQSGRVVLRRVDPVEAFAKGLPVNERLGS